MGASEINRAAPVDAGTQAYVAAAMDPSFRWDTGGGDSRRSTATLVGR